MLKNFLFSFTFLFFTLTNISANSQNEEVTNLIDEIVVTSQKRVNAIAAQDLPGSVTAINEDLIIKSDS